MLSATYPNEGRGLDVLSGVGIRLGLAVGPVSTPIPVNSMAWHKL